MGNPDVRVPKVIESEEGLPRGKTPCKEDARGNEERDEIGAEEKNGLTKKTESPKTCGANATTTKEEDTEGRESRHVPGGTWLHQQTPAQSK
ncbi:hypothetical protein NDU88_005434 [Pleurodeles waltl]|uniref:Uncharacterized protein n=1 Tax=Pleurodeles waltl TaxID=8319 RepID=A0AAV7UI31_PLEWA|nr:hypothetical protein NDU88_005434 [Pleurodeles waltl]